MNPSLGSWKMLHGFGGPGTRGEFQLYQYLLEGLWFNLKGEPPQNTRAHSKVKQVWQKRPAWLNIDLMTDLTKKEKKKRGIERHFQGIQGWSLELRQNNETTEQEELL